MELWGLQHVRLVECSIEVEKDSSGRIGIAIGGGAPHSPCLYIVDVFAGGPIAADGRLRVGDELLAVKGIGVKGQDKMKVASLIRQAPNPIRLSVNRLQLPEDSISGGSGSDRLPSLDIFIKKLKHRFVESIDPEIADSLGLSRAILSNDLMSRLTQRLDVNIAFYRELIKQAEEVRSIYAGWGSIQNRLGLTLADVANKETRAEDRCLIGAVADCNRGWAKEQERLAEGLTHFVKELRMYADKAVPDTQQSMRKYLDAKYAYLSFCLKAKEMEDEEAEILSDGGQLQRVMGGNIEYRIILRHKEKSRQQFIELRKHAMIKLQLLEEKHVMELALQLKRVLEALSKNHLNCRDLIRTVTQTISMIPATSAAEST